MSLSKPSRGLNSIKVEKSLQRNILPAIHNKVNVLTCRASYLPEESDKSVLVDKKDCLDEVISKINGVEFFISCLTGTTTNCGNAVNAVRPAVAYFISFKKGISGCESEVFQAIHDIDLDATVSLIKTSSSKDPVLQTLKQVVKDHNSTYSKNIIDQWQSKNNNQPKTSCNLVAVDKGLFYSLKNAYYNLKNDGMNISYNFEENNIAGNLSIEPTTGIGKAIQIVKCAMKKVGHALYSGEIYKKAEHGQFSYVPFCTVDYYLQLLIRNPAIQDDIILHLPRLTALIADPGCKVIEQLVFHFDLIEVRGGYCLKLSSRSFVKTPLSLDDIGKISPRSFSNYHIKDRSGGYFENSVKNSFPDLFERVNFLNKFYQCLLFGQLPHKCRKLVCEGLGNSGKSSWAKVFFGLLRPSKIATITKEKTFGMAMLKDDTEFIFLDEWCDESMGVSNAKLLLQGGYLVKAVKNQDPAPIVNNAGMLICCNKKPYYFDEQPNIDSRIHVFKTQPLKTMHTEAPQWIEDNAMRCVAWIIREINANVACIPIEERFYEKEVNDLYDITLKSEKINVEMQKIMALNSTDIREVVIEKHFSLETSDEPEDEPQYEPEDEESVCSNDTDCLEITDVSGVDESDVDWDEVMRQPKRAYRLSDFNTKSYYKEVRRIINNNMDAQGGRVSYTHYLAYTNSFSRENPAVSYTKPDPKLDAWMCVAGRKRDVFNVRGFVNAYPSIKQKIEQLRVICKFDVPKTKSSLQFIIPDVHSTTSFAPLKRMKPTCSDSSDEDDGVKNAAIEFYRSTNTKRRIIELSSSDSEDAEKATGSKLKRNVKGKRINENRGAAGTEHNLNEIEKSSSNIEDTSESMTTEHLESVTFKRGSYEYMMNKKVTVTICRMSNTFSHEARANPSDPSLLHLTTENKLPRTLSIKNKDDETNDSST